MRRAVIPVFILSVFFAGCATTAQYSEYSDQDLMAEALKVLQALDNETEVSGRRPDFNVVWNYQAALVQMGPRAVETIASFASDDDKDLKLLAIPVLGVIGTERALEVVCEMYLKTRKTSVRDECAIALGAHADKRVLDRLLKIAGRKKYPTRRARAVTALAAYPEHEKIVKGLAALLDDETPVTLAQEVESGWWPFYGRSWELDEAGLCDYALAALAKVTGENYGYEYGDNLDARIEAVRKWKARTTD